MAGDRHHIVPRFLLRGFASKVIPKAKKDDSVFVWAYRQGQEPFECNIVNVNVENQFYGDHELNVDDEITNIEPRFAKALTHLRNSDDGTKVTDDAVIEFVVHLTARTKHVRDFAIDSGGFLSDWLFGYFAEYGNFREYCVRRLTQRPELIGDRIENAIRTAPMSAHKKAMARQRFKRMTPERIVQLVMDGDAKNYEETFQSLREQLALEINDMAKQAHIKSLLKDLLSEPRVAHYKTLRWYVRRSEEPIILGDACCLFELKDSSFKSLGGVEETIRIYLPVSSDCVLVGTTLAEVPAVDVSLMNETSAKLSRNNFVSSVNTPEMVRLSALLGSESQWLTQDEMENIVSELLYGS